MQKLIARAEPVVYALLRIVAGLLFLQHGLQKVFGLLGGTAVPLASRSGAAGIIEIVTGPLIALGIFTPVAALIASGEMAFAYFLVHAPQHVWPIVNRGELAALYCFLFLYIAVRGAGRFAIQRGR
jgi:putative oxidoreductase